MNREARSQQVIVSTPFAESFAGFFEQWTLLRHEAFGWWTYEGDDPEKCWRCDAAEGQDPLGLCPTCKTDLER